MGWVPLSKAQTEGTLQDENSSLCVHLKTFLVCCFLLFTSCPPQGTDDHRGIWCPAWYSETLNHKAGHSETCAHLKTKSARLQTSRRFIVAIATSRVWVGTCFTSAHTRRESVTWAQRELAMFWRSLLLRLALGINLARSKTARRLRKFFVFLRGLKCEGLFLLSQQIYAIQSKHKYTSLQTLSKRQNRKCQILQSRHHWVKLTHQSSGCTLGCLGCLKVKTPLSCTVF